MASLNPLDRDNLGQTGFEADQGFSLDKPADPLEQQVGADDDLQRGLERVAALEAWLSGGREHTNDLNAFGDSPKDGIPQQPTINQGIGVSQGQDRTLVVIDSRLSNWQQVADALPSDADLLLLDQGRSGLQQVEEAALSAKRDGSPYRAVALLGGKSEDGSIQFGNDDLGGKDTSDANRRLAQLETGILGNADLKLFSDSSFDAPQTRTEGLTSRRLVETKLGLDATNELDAIKAFLQRAQSDGRAQAAISSAFTLQNQSPAAKKLKAFIDGEETPLIRWASFDDSKVQGAFIAETNTILISEELRGSSNKIQAVVLEEIGHWLEADANADSGGDEGDVFANAILSQEESIDDGNDRVALSINGQEFTAELSEPNEGAPIDRKLDNRFDITTISYENDSSGRKIKLGLTSPADATTTIIKTYFEIQLNGQSIAPHINHFTNAYLEDGNQTLVLEVNDNLRESNGGPHLLDQPAYENETTYQKLRIAYTDTSGSGIDSLGLRTNVNNSILGLLEDSWAINHPRIFGSHGTELIGDVAHRGPSVDIDGRKITIWSTEELDTTAPHNTIEPIHFAVYSGRENSANSVATKFHIVESVTVNPADKQQITITLNDSTPLDENSIVEIEYEYPGFSDGRGR